MEHYEWAEANLEGRVDPEVSTPHDLQRAGVHVYFAPHIEADRKVVNLGTGEVEQFFADEGRPQEGYYADFDSLEQFCRRNGLPFQEVDARAILLATVSSNGAGDPRNKEGY